MSEHQENQPLSTSDAVKYHRTKWQIEILGLKLPGFEIKGFSAEKEVERHLVGAPAVIEAQKESTFSRITEKMFSILTSFFRKNPKETSDYHVEVSEPIPLNPDEQRQSLEAYNKVAEELETPAQDAVRESGDEAVRGLANTIAEAAERNAENDLAMLYRRVAERGGKFVIEMTESGKPRIRVQRADLPITEVPE